MKWKQFLDDRGWSERTWPPTWQIGLTTFGILALELALIRWTTSQVRVFAYFNNVVLICAFLGMGLGVALGRRYPGLVRLVLPMLLLLAVPLAFSESLGLVHMRFPDHAISLWGGDQLTGDPWLFGRNLAIFCLLLLLVTLVFGCAGAPLGLLFQRAPVWRAYAADLGGSLLGIGCFSVLAWQECGPAWWLALGGLPFVWLTRSYLDAGLLAVIVGLGQFTAQGVFFSPYNRIELESAGAFGIELRVNRDFHQYMYDLSDCRLAGADRGQLGVILQQLRRLYDLPFVLNERRGTALIVGAGTGNDVQAALRHGYARITSVDIDGRIIATGRQRHPEHPYAAAAVQTVVDDARAFFQRQSGELYDVVCYGLLDSHAMSSAMSTLRLDNYVYTEEGVRAAWRHVGPNGHLSLAISCNSGRWFFERLYWMVARATGREPLAFYSPLHYTTVTFVVPRPGARLDPAVVAQQPQLRPVAPREQTLTPSDDWPFLYIRPGVFPWGYLIVLAFILTLAAITVPLAFGWRHSPGAGLDGPLFLMGAAFLLIETRGITSMSLLFGSTWLVNAAIFGGILAMVLAANLAVQRWQWRDPLPWFWVLFAAVILLYCFPVTWLQAQSLLARGVCAGLLTGWPVGCAGVIVPLLLARAAQPAAALGANLLGAVLGGCLEYFSMLGGLKSTALLALVLYLMAYLILRRRPAPGLEA